MGVPFFLELLTNNNCCDKLILNYNKTIILEALCVSSI